MCAAAVQVNIAEYDRMLTDPGQVMNVMMLSCKVQQQQSMCTITAVASSHGVTQFELEGSSDLKCYALYITDAGALLRCTWNVLCWSV
jgi:hypothetical protein